MTIRLTFPNGEIAEFADNAPPELMAGVESAYSRFGSLRAVDQWRRMESLRTDESFLGLPRIERHKLFNQLALESPDFWGTMAPDKRRIFRDGMVEAEGSNQQDAYSYWEAPIHFRDETQSKADSVIEEFLNGMKRATPTVLAGTAAGILTIADEAKKASAPMIDGAKRYFNRLDDTRAQYDSAAKTALTEGNGQQKPGQSKLELLAKQARELAQDASIGAETLAPAPKIDRFGKVHGWDDFTMYVAQALGQQAPVMGTMVAAGMVPGIGTGLVFAAGGGLETGSILDDMARNGIKGEEATKTAALYGGLAGLLEAAPLASWMKRTPGVSQTFRQALVKRLAEVPIQGLAEAGTEFMQTIVEQTALDIMEAERGNLEAVSWATAEGRKSLWDEATEAAIQGGLIGGIMGGAGGPQYNQAQLEEAQAAREAAANQAPPTEEPPPGQTFRTADLPQNEPDLVPEGDQGPRVPPIEPMAPIEDQLPPPPEGAVWAEGQWWSRDGKALGNQFDRKAGQPPVDLAKINIPELPLRLDEEPPAADAEPRPGEMATATEEMYGKEETEPIKAPVLVETDEGMATFNERQSKPEETNSWFSPIGKDGMGWAVLNDSEGLQSNIGAERAVFVEKVDPDGTATVRDQDGNIEVISAFDETGRPNLFAPNSAKGAEYMRQLSAKKSRGGLDIFSEEGGYNAVFNESSIDRDSQLESFGGNEDDIRLQYEMDEARWAAVAEIRKNGVKVTEKIDKDGRRKLRVPKENKDISPTFRRAHSSGATSLDELGDWLKKYEPEIYNYFAGQIAGAGGSEVNPIEVARQLFKGPNPKPNPKKYNFGENRTVGQGTEEDTYGVFYKGSWTEDQAADIVANRAEEEATGGLSAAQMEEEAAQDTSVEPEPFDLETRGLFDEETPANVQKGSQTVKGEELSPLFGGKQEASEGPKQTNREKIADLKASIKELEAVKEKNSGQKAAIADNYRQLRILEKGRKPQEMTKEEYLKGVTGVDEVAIAKAGHAKAVRTAVLAGEKVPAAVLEDYKNNGWAKTALEKTAKPSRDTIDEARSFIVDYMTKDKKLSPEQAKAKYIEVIDRGDQRLADDVWSEILSEAQQVINARGAVPASEVKSSESIAPALSPEQKLSDRQTTAEEDIATIFGEDGQGSLFDVASPEQIKKNLSVRLKHLRGAFANPKWKFERGDDGTVLLKIANGPTLSFSFSNDLVAERAAAHGGDYEKLAKSIAKGYEFSEDRIAQIAEKLQANHGLIKGSYTFDSINASHLIVLNRLSAGPDTLFHEAFHFVFKNYLRPSQRKTLIEHYGNEEKAAKAYGVLAEKQFKNLEKMNAAERILYEVYDFARQMLKYMAGDPQSAADLMEAIYSGQIYEQPWLGTARLHSTESASGRLRIFSGGPDPVLKMISREIKNSVEFEDGTTIKAELSQESYDAAINRAMKQFVPTALGGRLYSRLAEVVVDASQKKWGSAKEFLNWVEKQPGVKQEEIYWTGLKQWAEMQEGPITRADAQVYLSNNGVKIEEKIRGGKDHDLIQGAKERLDSARSALSREVVAMRPLIPSYMKDKFEQVFSENDYDAMLEVVRSLSWGKSGVDITDLYQAMNVWATANDELEKLERVQQFKTDTKWSGYTEPGGENYRELTIRFLSGKGYVSHAFPEKDIVVWVRFNERTDENGRRVLFIEEIQSDLHQEGKKAGYTTGAKPRQVNFNTWGKEHGMTDAETEAAFGDDTNKLYREWRVEQDQAMETILKESKAVPDTPFKGNLWPELALKRMMIWAAENGFDRVSWTTSEQQARRANQLIEGLGRVQYNPETKVLTAFEKDGEGALRRGRLAGTWEVEPEDLPRYVGADATKQLLASPVKDDRWGPVHEIEGEGLRINASSFEALYDKTLRNIASKLGKKHGAAVDVKGVGMEEVTPEEGGQWVVVDENNDEVVYRYDTQQEAEDRVNRLNAQLSMIGEDVRFVVQTEGEVVTTNFNPQQGIDIGGTLRDELLAGETTMFELEGMDWDEEPVRVADAETLYSPETSGPVDGFQSPGVVLNRTLIKEWFREHVIRNLFDKLEPLRYLQEVLTESGQKLHESMDAYLKARNFSGRAGAALNKLESEYFQPLINKLAELEMPLKQFEEIRMAIHALEANPLMFRRHVVVKKAALKARIAKLEKVGVRKGMNVRVPGKVGVSGKVAAANREAGTVTVEWLDRDEGRVRAKEFKLAEVERDSLAQAKEKMKEIDDMVAADKVPHSGLTSADARQILRDARQHGWVTFEGEPMRQTKYGGKAMQVSMLFDKIVKWKEERLVSSGLLKQEELDRWKKDYKYYTPMRGKEPDILDWIYGGDRPPIPEIEYHGSMWYRALDTMARAAGHEGEVHKPNVGRGYNPGSRKPARRRLGRESRPTHSPTVELFADAMELAVRSEKNRVAKTVWNLFQSLKGAEDVDGKPLFFFDEPPMKPYFDEKTQTVKERPDYQAMRQPNVYDVWIDGERHFVRSESRELAGLFSVLNNIGPESAPKVLRGVAGINRYIAKMATSRNPAFAIPNAVRDFLTAGIRLTTTHKELGTQILKKIPHSAKILAEYARLDTAGELDKMDQSVRKRIEKWKEAGGETAFWMIPRLSIQAKNMSKELRKAAGDEAAIFHYGRKVIRFLEDYNGALEGAARFTAFERALELGASLDKAALVSREITVDFTRQGEWAGWLGSLYVFSNASLQGSRMVYDTLKTPGGQKWLMGLSSLGFMMGMAGRVMGGDDPEDDTAYWDKLTNYEKSRNLIFMLPGTEGKRLKIPLPWGFNVPVMVGQMVSDAVLSDKVSGVESAAAIMSSAMSAFNPIGDNDLNEASGWWQMLAPSWADPAVDVAFNKTFWGGPIMPGGSSFKKSEQYGIPGKDHMRYFSSVSKTSKEFTKGLYKLTGLDVSPETVDYMVGALAGGLGDVVNKTINLAPAMAARHSLAAHEIPVLRSFYADESEFYAPQTYRANMGQFWQHYEELKEIKKENPREAAAYQRRWAHILNLHETVKATEKKAAEMKKSGVDRNDPRMQKLFKNFNRMYDRVEANKRRAQRSKPSIMNQ